MSHNSPQPEQTSQIQRSENFSRFGRYQRIELIGQGGMGKVYKAYDPILDRYVALKLIQSDTPESAIRFSTEARAQAKIDHPHVCKIYEVGEVEGTRYIAMQLISGRVLTDLAPELRFRQIAKILKQVAEGVHAAHQAGLIHRDLKPTNILIEKNAQEELVPYVLDFGLAREMNAGGLTLSGVLIGTPNYMSPEQARGEPRGLDPRTDVYSLGITCYELLTNKLPFAAESTVDTLLKLLNEDPAPLRQQNPDIPADLEKIILKCLQKDPALRYDSALSLAEDLGRFLEGEPIRARAPSLSYRLSKKARKHGTIVIVSALAVILFVSFLTYVVYSQWKSSRQAELAQQFGQEVKEIENILHFAHMLPLHDISAEKKKIRNRMQSINLEMKTVGEFGRGPGNYALGRGYLALQDSPKAYEHLMKSWELGYREPQVAYSLGLALGDIYQKELEVLEGIRGKELKESQRLKLERQYRDPALQYLKREGVLNTEVHAYGVALIAFYERKWTVALALVQESIERFPWHYESRQLLGDIHLANANIQKDAGDEEKAMANYNSAESAYREAARIAESDPRAYTGMCNVWRSVMEMKLYGSGGDLEPYKKKSESACLQSIQADPSLQEPWYWLSNVYRIWGQHLEERGQDPTGAWRKGEQLAQHSLHLDPKSAAAMLSLGVIYRRLAEYEMAHGQDPEKTLHSSIKALEQAIQLNRGAIFAYNSLGNALSLKASLEMRRGSDPRNSLKQSIDVFEQSIGLNSNYYATYVNLGVTYMELATYEMQHGIDPVDSHEAAIRIYRKALALNPGSAIVYNNLANVYKDRALYKFDHSQEPTPDLKTANELYKQAMKIKADYPITYVNAASGHRLLAMYELSQSRNPDAQLQLALHNIQTSLKINPSIAETHYELANVYLLNARQAIEKNKSPVTALEASGQALKNALEVDPDSFLARLGKVDLVLMQAEWHIQNRQNPQRWLDSANDTLQQLLKLKADSPDGLERAGRLCRWQAEWKIRNGVSAEAEIAEGLERIESALRIDSKLASAYFVKGILLYLRRDSELATAAFNQAISMNQNLKNEVKPFLMTRRWPSAK